MKVEVRNVENDSRIPLNQISVTRLIGEFCNNAISMRDSINRELAPVIIKKWWKKQKERRRESKKKKQIGRQSLMHPLNCKAWKARKWEIYSGSHKNKKKKEIALSKFE